MGVDMKNGFKAVLLVYRKLLLLRRLGGMVPASGTGFAPLVLGPELLALRTGTLRLAVGTVRARSPGFVPAGTRRPPVGTIGAARTGRTIRSVGAIRAPGGVGTVRAIGTVGSWTLGALGTIAPLRTWTLGPIAPRTGTLIPAPGLGTTVLPGGAAPDFRIHQRGQLSRNVIGSGFVTGGHARLIGKNHLRPIRQRKIQLVPGLVQNADRIAEHVGPQGLHGPLRGHIAAAQFGRAALKIRVIILLIGQTA
jgi:hypothetical protein